jgi:hypothetical protein
VIPIDVHVSGSLFDGRYERALDRGITDAKRDVATRGVVLVRTRMRVSFRYHSSPPTGRASRRVMVDNTSGTRVTDGRNIYTPWLEGVGSRNATSRFKGYFMFRLAAQTLRGEAGAIASSAIARATGGL